MFEQKAFSFSVDCKNLEQCIKKVSSVSGNSASFFLGIYKKSVCVFAISSDTFAMLSVPNSETADSVGIFGFSSEVLPGLIKGRAVMDFKFDGNECQFSQTKGKYSGKLASLSVTEDQISQISARVQEKSSGATIPNDVWATIRLGISATSVKDVYQNTPLLSYITINEDGRIVVSSFDPQHFGLFRLKTEFSGSKFRAAIPQAHFAMIDQMSGGLDAIFSLSSARLRVSGKGFLLILPATQAEDRHFNMVPTFIKELPKPTYSGTCEVDQLSAVADNIYTLYNANSNFLIKTKGEAFSIGLSTSSGSASDAIRVKTKSAETKLSVDPRLFMDLLSLAKSLKVVQLSVTDKVLSIIGKRDGADVYLSCSRIE